MQDTPISFRLSFQAFLYINTWLISIDLALHTCASPSLILHPPRLSSTASLRHAHLFTQYRSRLHCLPHVVAYCSQTPQNSTSAMASLLILLTPCIALMAPLLSPAVSITLVLALTIALTTTMPIFLWQTRKMDYDDDENGNENESEAVIEDATHIVHAAFAALAMSPGATSTSFRVVNSTLMHNQNHHSTAGVTSYGDGSADGFRSEEEEVGAGKHNEWQTGARASEQPIDTRQEYGVSPRIGSRRRGYPLLGGFDHFRVSVRGSVEGPEGMV